MIVILRNKRWIQLNLSVTNSPFTEGQAAQINELIQTLTPEQKVWLSGYLVANQQLTSNGTVPSQTGSSSTNANGLTEGTEAINKTSLSSRRRNEQLHFYMVPKQEMHKG